MTSHISPTDTAKLIRKTLAQVFPGQKFSVTTRGCSSGDTTATIRWHDGPDKLAVSAVAYDYCCRTNGVRYGIDVLYFNRSATPEAELMQEYRDF